MKMSAGTVNLRSELCVVRRRRWISKQDVLLRCDRTTSIASGLWAVGCGLWIVYCGATLALKFPVSLLAHAACTARASSTAPAPPSPWCVHTTAASAPPASAAARTASSSACVWEGRNDRSRAGEPRCVRWSHA